MATAFFVVGAAIQTASQNYHILEAGRFIGGIGVGTLAMGAALYISEIAPPSRRIIAGVGVNQYHHRRHFGMLDYIWNKVSNLYVVDCVLYLKFHRAIPGDWSFRFPFLLQILPALVVGCGIHFFPLSPRWLAMRERNEKSLAALAKHRRRPDNDSHIQLEWKGI